MSQSAESLRGWELPGLVRIETGPGGLPRLDITSPLARAQVYLHGAHVAHYQPTGHSPVLFMSEASRFAPGQAIRGGVPVIFPWFGAHVGRPDLPAHGFARTRPWELESAEKWPDETVALVLRLLPDDATRALWPHDFVLRHRIHIGRRLEMRLEVENWSPDPFTFEEALHTYLAVRDVRQVTVTGLEGVSYLDKTDSLACKLQEGAVRITGETDRVYNGTSAPCVVHDEPGGRRLLIGKSGSETTVVWNPWVEKAKAMSDYGDDEWPRMICVETANTGADALTLPPGETHIIQATVSVER